MKIASVARMKTNTFINKIKIKIMMNKFLMRC